MSSHDVKSMAAAAAAAAASNVAPAQRQRAIEEAAAAIISSRMSVPIAGERVPLSTEGTAATNSEGPTPYVPPDWGGPPKSVGYTLEVLREGVIVDQQDIHDQDHYTLGRHPSCDLTLEHPSVSRLHAVIQYHGGTSEAFLYDCGSTHGTFLNKNKIKAQVHVPLHVGDTFKIGQSSRVYIFGGPPELLPEEGLNREERRRLRMLELAQKQKEKDEQLAQAQMQAALSSREVSWGMMEDAPMDEDPTRGIIDWRQYVDKHPITDKMTKLVEKIRRKEYKVNNLKKEIERIQAKERLEAGLTPGQASTLARNEQAIDKLTEEMEDLEELLLDSIRDSLKDRQKDAPEQTNKRRRRALDESDEEYLAGGDSEDEFFDRTAASKGKSVKLSGNVGPGGGRKAKQVVESAETLHGKKTALMEEKQRLLLAIAQEEELEKAVEKSEGRQPAEEEHTSGETPAVDSLDAFMTTMEGQLEKDKVGALRRELQEVEEKLDRVEKLLKVADPDGWYKPSKGAADAAKERARLALEKERKRRTELMERRKAREHQLQGPFVPEEEGEEERQEQVSVAGPMSEVEVSSGPHDGGRTQQAISAPPSQVTSSREAGPDKPGQQEGGHTAQVGSEAGVSEAAGPRGSPRATEDPPSNSGPTSDGIIPTAPAKPVVLQFQAPRKIAGRHTSRVNPQGAPGQLDQDLALLARASQGVEVEEHEPEGNLLWRPPAGQTGDGRTHLNDKYGY